MRSAEPVSLATGWSNRIGRQATTGVDDAPARQRGSALAEQPEGYPGANEEHNRRQTWRRQLSGPRGASRESMRFAQTLKEVAPLVEALRLSGNDLDGAREMLADLVRLQQRLVARVARVFEDAAPRGSSLSLVSYAPFRRRVSESLAVYLMQVGADCLEKTRVIEDSVVELAELAWGSVDGTPQQVGDHEVTEPAAWIKIALLPMNVRLNTILSLYKEEAAAQRLIRDTNRIAIQATREVAFVRAERLGIEQREMLFMQVLPVACELVEWAWFEQLFGEALVVSIAPPSRAGLWRRLTNLEAALRKEPMGYDSHPEYSIDWLLEHLGDELWARIEALAIPGNLPPEVRAALRGLYLRAIESATLSAWHECAQAIVERVEAMDAEQFRVWSENEGARPMPLEDVLAAIDQRIAEGLSSRLLPDVNLDIIRETVENRLAVMWGLTDALCQAQGFIR